MTGETISHYTILEKLGEGGMGEVYKAQDTKLDRYVALKFLPSSMVATDADKARFIQEAKAASALNHTNVCTIYDIQEYEAEGGAKKLFIVMEFVDGETLGAKKNLSVKQILEIGTQAAEGLAAAHEKGIVHRDIKPENIMVRKDGRVQIMDFGLTKLHAGTEASRLTQAGSRMGTVGYMSPEQVQGQDVDHRSDIFSLGVVLYELLTGESPFKGVHETAILYEIVNVDPEPVSVRKEGLDPELDGILFECLEKDKDERYQSARELAKDLKRVKRDTARSRQSRITTVRPTTSVRESQLYTRGSTISATTEQIEQERSSGNKNFIDAVLNNPKIFWSASALLLVVVILLFISPFGHDHSAQEVKSTILPPSGVTTVNIAGSNLTISPLGHYISFVGADSAGITKLWLRPINSLTARPLAEVGNDAYPFWSPDEKFIAYFNNGKLMKISLTEGTSLLICDAPNGRGGTWNKEGMIVFAPNATGGLSKVPYTGGTAEPIIAGDTSTLSRRWPYFLPDGKHYLYSTQHSQSGSSPLDQIFVGSISGDTGKPIITVPSNAQFTNGYIFYVRQSILIAQQFDPGSLTLSGDGMPVAENLQYYDIRISGSFSVSITNMIVYQEDHPEDQNVVELDTKGNVAKTLFHNNIYRSAVFSPDGKKIVFDSYSQSDKNIDVWTYDIQRNVTTRLTFDPAVDFIPQWTPDGKQIAYSSNPGNGSFNIFVKNADGSGKQSLLWKSPNNMYAASFSADGKYLLCGVIGLTNRSTSWDIGLLTLGGEMKLEKYLETDFAERWAAFSPNGKWVAYTSNESGKFQVYIAPFNNGSGKWQISIDNGAYPVWMDNGKKIYFFTVDNKVMGVDIHESGMSLSPDRPYQVFSSPNTNISLYDIDKSGTRILASVPESKKTPSYVTLIANWSGGRKSDQ